MKLQWEHGGLLSKNMLFHNKVACFDWLVQTLVNLNNYAMGDTAAIINQVEVQAVTIHAAQEMRKYTIQIKTAQITNV